MPAAHPLTVLERHSRIDVVIQAPDRPPLVRLAGRVILLRSALHKRIRPADRAAADRKGVARITRVAALNKAELPADVERITPSPVMIDTGSMLDESCTVTHFEPRSMEATPCGR